MEAPDRPGVEDLLGQARFVHALARALVRDDGLAHDVAQDALLVALQQQERPASWRGWLTAVTRRLAAAMRADRCERARREARAARPEGGDDERRTAARLALQRRLCEAVLELPEPYRTAVTLRHLDGLSPRAIARRLSREVEVVRQQVHRGLAMLRRRLDREFGDRSGWTSALAACGLWSAAATLLVPVLLMKKIAIAAAVLLAVGVWWSWRGAEARPRAAAVGTAAMAGPAADSSGAAPPAAAGVALAADARPLTRTELRFAVRVVDEEGQPLRHVTVRCWGAEGEAVVRQTADDGRADFAPSDAAGAVRVEAEGRPPRLLQVLRMLGEQQVVLPRGAEVSGLVLVEGERAPAGLRIGLHAGPVQLPPDLPAAAARWLQERRYRPQCEARTQDDGGFAFCGLPADWSGGLELPTPYWLLPDSPEQWNRRCYLQLPAPARGLVLRTTQIPTLAGSVVWDDTGAAVERAELTCFVGFADGSSAPGTSVAAEADGTFAIGFYPMDAESRGPGWLDPQRRSQLARANLQVSAPGSDGTRKLELDAEQLRQPVVVRLPRAAATFYLAVDERGAPVAGARVQAGGSLGEPTGADGRGRFDGPRRRALVGAPGHRVVPAVPRTAATGRADEPLVFVLPPDSELRLRLRTRAGGVPEPRRIQLTSAGNLLAGRFQQSELERLLGSSRSTGGSARAISELADGTQAVREPRMLFEADARGEVVLHSLMPNLPVTVEVIDVVGTVLLRQEITTPAAGESTPVDLVVVAEPRQLEGVVLGPDGLPLFGASVQCALPGNVWILEERSGRDGRFAFAGICSDAPLSLWASKPGFAAQAIGDRTRDGDGQPIVFQLQPGHRVHASVRAEDGSLVPVRIRVDTGGAAPPRPQERSLGEYEYADLPPATVTFSCTWGGRRFTLQHDAREGEAVLRVPTPARVEVAVVPGYPEPQDGFHLTALASRLDAVAEPVEVQLAGEYTAPQLLLPGRYRVALVAQRWRDDLPERRPLGPATEVTLLAGELRRIQLP